MIILLIVLFLLSSCIFIGMIRIRGSKHIALPVLAIAGLVSSVILLASYLFSCQALEFETALRRGIPLVIVNLLINSSYLLKTYHLPIKPDLCCSLSDVRENRLPVMTGGNTFTVKVGSLLMIFPEYSKISFWDEQNKFLTTENTTALFNTSFYKVDIASFKKKIIGSYISNGRYVKQNNISGKLKLSMFIWNKNGFKFVPYEDVERELEKASAIEGTSAFTQLLLIYNGVSRDLKNDYFYKKCYRVLAEYHGQLCIVEGCKPDTFSHFRNQIEQLGLTNALYLDKNAQADESWIRRKNGKKQYCFLRVFEKHYNCMTFEK